MAKKIPSWIWLLVGLVIAFTSWYVEMTLFFWLGWIFIVVGIAKFIIDFTTGEKETPQEKKIVKQATHYGCTCGNVIRATDSFCHNCGIRLR